MRVLRDPALTASIKDDALRELVAQRFCEVAQDEPYNADTYGFFVVAEPGDSVELLEQETGCPILGSPFTDVRFGEPNFSPCFEFLAEHEVPACYEMVFVLSDGGFGIDLFVPKLSGMDARLLNFCATYATPASPTEKAA
jgi:hypothetical protein